jgi:hypothetical protein
MGGIFLRQVRGFAVLAQQVGDDEIRSGGHGRRQCCCRPPALELHRCRIPPAHGQDLTFGAKAL